jgi:hypothetical protein
MSKTPNVMTWKVFLSNNFWWCFADVTSNKNRNKDCRIKISDTAVGSLGLPRPLLCCCFYAIRTTGEPECSHYSRGRKVQGICPLYRKDELQTTVKDTYGTNYKLYVRRKVGPSEKNVKLCNFVNDHEVHNGWLQYSSIPHMSQKNSCHFI